MARKAAAGKHGLTVTEAPQVFYRINSLLYTLRSIAQFEDQLCMLLHHLRTSGKLNAALSTELREILAEIPSAEYLHDLEALRTALESESGVPQPAAAGARGAKKHKAA